MQPRPDVLIAAPASRGRIERNPAGRICALSRRDSFASYLVLALALLLTLIATRAVSAADFAHNYGGQVGNNVTTTGSAADSAGNHYVSGFFDGATLTIGVVNLTRIGDQDAFVAKFDASGSVVWARAFGGIGAKAFAQAVVVDGQGNVYVSGYFGTADLTSPPLTRFGFQDIFAIKLDASGATTWAHNFGGGGAYAFGMAIALDGSGHAYLGGYFQNGNLTSPPVPQLGTVDAVAIKLSPAGQALWGKNVGGGLAWAYGQAIAVDSASNVFLGGYFNFGSMASPPLPLLGGQDAFVVAVDSGGSSILWSKHFGGSGAYSYGYSIACDGVANVYLGGTMQGDLSIPPLPKIGNVDAFAFKIDKSNGGIVWAENFGGTSGAADGRSIALDTTGHLFLGGMASGTLTKPTLLALGTWDVLAIELDAAAGGVSWAKNFGGSGASVNGTTVAVDGSGNAHLDANFAGADLTQPALPRIGTQDGLAIRFDVTGSMSWAGNFGSVSPGGHASIEAVATDASGNEYVAGYFDGRTLTLGGVTLNEIGDQDAFVAKVDSIGNILWARNYGGRGTTASAEAIAFDASSGSVHVAGNFAFGNLTTPPIASTGIRDALVITLDSAGTTTGFTAFGGAGSVAYANAIAVGGAGAVYVAGRYQFADLTTPALPRLGAADAFVIKLDATGATAWARHLGGPGAFTSGWAISTDTGGNAYFGGNFVIADLTNPPLTKIGNTDALLVKIDSTGNTVWARNYGGSGADASINAVAVDGPGSVYLAGSFDGAALTTPPLAPLGAIDAFAIKVDPSGAVIWARNFGGNAFANASSIAIDGTGSAYIGGEFHAGNLAYPPLFGNGAQAALMMKLDGGGGLIWARAFGYPGSAAAKGIAVVGTNGAFLGGYLSGGGLLSPPLTQIGLQDALIVNGTYYVVSYNGNGSDGGSVPIDTNGHAQGETVRAADKGTLTKSGYFFAGWNTAADGSGTHYNFFDALIMPAANVTLYAQWSLTPPPPTLQQGQSRKVHGAAGTFDLPLSLISTDPTTEPRAGPTHTVVFTFDQTITGANAAITEGTGTAGAVTFSGNNVLVSLTGVTNRQYVTITLTNIAVSLGNTGGTAGIRIGFLAGDVNATRVVTLADLGLVNAQLSQAVTLSNFLKDVNASGSITVADKGITNANLTKALPAP